MYSFSRTDFNKHDDDDGDDNDDVNMTFSKECNSSFNTSNQLALNCLRTKSDSLFKKYTHILQVSFSEQNLMRWSNRIAAKNQSTNSN